MTRFARPLLAAAAVLALTACADTVTDDSSFGSLDLAPAFSTLPSGYSEVLNSYAGAEGEMLFSHNRGPGHGGPRDGLAMGVLMGGGFSDMVLGGGGGRGPRGHGGGGHHGPGLGLWGFGDGRVDSSCTFNATSGRVVCPAVTRNGITINKSVQYLNAAGAVQQAFDTLTTNTVNTQTTSAGTFTRVRRHGRNSTTGDTAVVTVNNSSNRTVAGLAAGSTQYTLNGTASGRESTAARDSIGAYTALRVVGDTIRGVTIPVTTVDSLRYPKAGSVVHQMAVTISGTGRTTTNSTRREVITYNGTNTATVVITRDGTTTTCTIPLPRGRMVCPTSAGSGGR